MGFSTSNLSSWKRGVSHHFHLPPLRRKWLLLSTSSPGDVVAATEQRAAVPWVGVALASFPLSCFHTSPTPMANGIPPQASWTSIHSLSPLRLCSGLHSPAFPITASRGGSSALVGLVYVLMHRCATTLPGPLQSGVAGTFGWLFISHYLF